MLLHVMQSFLVQSVYYLYTGKAPYRFFIIPLIVETSQEFDWFIQSPAAYQQINCYDI